MLRILVFAPRTDTPSAHSIGSSRIGVVGIYYRTWLNEFLGDAWQVFFW